MATSLTFGSAESACVAAPGAPPSAADEADPEDVVAGRVGGRDRGQRAGGSGRPEEFPTGGRGAHERSFHFVSGCNSNVRTGCGAGSRRRGGLQSSAGTSTHSFRAEGAPAVVVAGRNGKSRDRASASSAAPYSETSNASMYRTRAPASGP